MDCSPPGSSVHEILQARILEWVAIPFSRGSSWPRDWTGVSCIGKQILYHWASREMSPATPTRAVNNFESGTSENGLICSFMKRGLLLSWTTSWSEQLLASCSATDLWNTEDKGLCLLETHAKERKGLLRCVLDQVTPQHPPKDAHLQCPEPVIIFLTWQRDLAGVMTVRVFTMGDDPGSSAWASLIARILGEGGRQAERRKDATGLG